MAFLDTSSLHQALLVRTCQDPYKVGISPMESLKTRTVQVWWLRLHLSPPMTQTEYFAVPVLGMASFFLWGSDELAVFLLVLQSEGRSHLCV